MTTTSEISAPDQVHSDAHDESVERGTPLDSDHKACGALDRAVAVDLADDHFLTGAHSSRVVGIPLADGHRRCDTRSTIAVRDQLAAVAGELAFFAAYLTDVEKLRIATENRIRALDQEEQPTVAYESSLTMLCQIEHEAMLNLKRTLRRHPLGAWVKRTIGVGEKQGARLLAALDNPAYNHAEGRPRRGPAELWAYCGFRPDQRRRKGAQSNWNAEAKMRVFLVAESCLKAKARSPYGPVYDRARVAWADRETSDLHKHNHALRVVAKEILKDLYLEAVRLGI